jgi:23S rRNA pseudouridine2605 synthase
MTLDRLLSRFGIASRTAAAEAIKAGRLKVNGRVIRDPTHWVRPALDAIHMDGIRLKPVRKRYFLFNKPKGVITSHGDPGGRKTIYDYLDPSLRWLAPVGRLDQDTSGLLLLTNDTEFADFIANPSSRIPKTYMVKLNDRIGEDVIAELVGGIKMARGDMARPRAVRRLEDRGSYSWLEVTLTEGKNREVRRMMEAVGFKVLKLVRVSIGPLVLEGLAAGSLRELTRAEIAALNRSRMKP